MGFFELIVIALIGLFVIGPERLPGAIRTVAMWVGRVRYFITETRSEFEKQIGADEIRRELHNEQVMRSLEALKKSKDDLENSIKESQNSILPDKEKEEEPPDYYPHDEKGHAVLDDRENQQHNNIPHSDIKNNKATANKNTSAEPEKEQSENAEQLEESSIENNNHSTEIQPNTTPTGEDKIQAATTK